MPFVSKEFSKAAKKAAEEKTRKEAAERQQNDAQLRQQAQEAEHKRLAEEEHRKRLAQQMKEKNIKKKLQKKEKLETKKREEELVERQTKRTAQMADLAKVMATPKEVADEIAIERLGFKIIRTEFARGQYSILYKAKKDGNDNDILIKLIDLGECPKKYREHLQSQAFKILRFIGGDGNQPKASQFPRIYDIFCIQSKVYVFLDECLKLSIYTRIKTKDTITELDAKQWAKQLSEAINVLQLSGICHRSIRQEHVIFDKEYKIKLIGFGKACIFWDNDTQRVIPQNKEKPNKKEIKLYDHFPQEVLKSDTYDPSSVDIWSLGVIICLLLNKETPFDPQSTQSYEEQWTQYSSKFQFSSEAKQLLDRIFVMDPTARLKIEEILRDPWITNEKPK